MLIEDPEAERKHLLDLLVGQLVEFVVVLADVQERFSSWHPGVQLTFGYEASEFIGMPVGMLFPEPDRSAGDPEREFAAAAATGKSSDTHWLITKTGERILVEGVTLGLRDESGKLTGFGKVLRNVTERRATEERLKALTSALEHSTVFVRKLDGTITHWTKGCERLYGWPAAEAAGQRSWDLLETKFPQPFSSIEEQLLLSGLWQGELGQTKRDGSSVYVSANWVLLYDLIGEPSAVICTHTDITSRVHVQGELEVVNSQLERLTLELERSNSELEEFARIASHDLSAPITSTRWLVDLLSSRHGNKLGEDGQKIVKQIATGLQRMSELVDAVLQHAKVGTTPIGSANGSDSFAALAAAKEDLHKDIELSGAEVTSGQLPLVRMSSQALAQLFQNLLSNAIKYRKPGTKPRVTITAERSGNNWEFRVSDNGIGIEQDWLERVFQPMQRRHGPEIAGSGIGLATCRKIVNRAGGKIWAESEVDQGTTIHFTVPATGQ
ncbi:MAG TPA: ATP-binding protein [Bryobacteraceae bacterium]|jgi:PAS domain S-box-containing protein|nr:ATP-binding protein [Bryobacteraceae bacterium]